MQTAKDCDLCTNPPAFMCNECVGHDMSQDGQEVVASMHRAVPIFASVKFTKKSILGQVVPMDFLYV